MVGKRDMQILEELMENSRLPFLRIAKKMRISEATVRKRVRDMQDAGVIKKFTTDVDPSKIGYGTTAIIGLDVSPEKFLENARKLATIEEVKWVATSSGDHMIMAEIWARDGMELTRLISEKIGSLTGVTKVCPAVILEKLK